VAPLPPVESSTVAAIWRAREAEAAADPRSGYEGYGTSASALGSPCDRLLWLTLRWASPPETPSGRQLRVFERGSLEEERVIAEPMTAFAAIVDRLFADPNLGLTAVYAPADGAPIPVRIIARRADEVTVISDARLWSETTRIDLRVGEVQSPRPGDRVEIAGETFVVQGEPLRDRERLVWTLDLRPG
jgi:hypothetical protein